MSHSTCAMRFSDGYILYGEYNGTVDVTLSNFYETQKEVQDNWRQQEWKICNNKEHLHEEVRLANSYGGGTSWNATACRECKVLVDYHAPRYEDGMIEDGLPEWYPDREVYLKYFGDYSG